MKFLIIVNLIATPFAVGAEQYSFKTKRLVIPYPPGCADLTARLLKAKRSEFAEGTEREGALIVAGTPEQLAQRVRSDYLLSQPLVKKA